MGKRGRATLHDVAGYAGVSLTTVSFVLSGRRDMRISAATEERVLQAARTLAYRRRLAPRRTPAAGATPIGLVSDVVASESFGGEMLRGCIAEATDQGHVVLMADSEGVEELETAAVESLLARGVDRFLYATLATAEKPLPPVLRQRRVVLLNTVDPTLPAPAVIPDDGAAGRAAATALIEAGHTTGIWLVGVVPAHGVAARRRLSGIRAGLRAAGLGLAGHVRCEWWPHEAREALTALLDARTEPRPTAVIAMNDRTAMGVYQAAAAAGLSIPHELSVVSFDNSDLARWLDPGLSSVDLPYFEMGQRGVELLLADATPARVHRLPMELRARASVAAPTRARQARPDPARRADRQPAG